jgi:hypothetical protein
MNNNELRDAVKADPVRYREVYRGKGNWDVYDMQGADNEFGTYIGTYWVS